MKSLLSRLGKVTCGQALMWSLAVNVVLFTLLMLSIVTYPDTGADVPAKAAQLQELRN